MREWFIVGAKLLGVYLLYWAITTIFVSISFLLHASSRGTPFSSELFEEAIVLINFFMVLIVVFVLLFKTERLADKINIPSDSIISSSATFSSANLRLGIIFIGVYIFTTRLGGLISVVWKYVVANRETNVFAATQPKGLPWSVDFIEPSIPVLLSLLLIFGADQISHWLLKDKNEDNI